MHNRPRTDTVSEQSTAIGRNTGRPTVLCLQQCHDAEIGRLVVTLQARVHTCQSGGEALAVARAHALACVVIPLDLPDMPAREFIDRLREVALGLPVIVIVDNPAVSEAVSVMRSGAHAVVDNRVLGSGLLPHLAPLLRPA